MDIIGMCLITAVLFSLLCITLYFTLAFIKWTGIQRHATGISKSSVTVGFFHPYCNAGGGGERVLWTAIRMLQNTYPKCHCIVYTGDTDAAKTDILKKVKERFNITIKEDIHFVFLKSRFLVEAKYYPHFTLLCQSLASMLLGLEALVKFVPDIYFDSMGYAFTFPVFRYLGSCHIGCYVHYPTISTDMLKAVSDRRVTINNDERISQNKYLSFIKSIYYKLFAWMYGYVGRRADVVMTNSSWTKQHIVSLWKDSDIQLVYPPCDVTKFQELPLPDSKKNVRIISVAQYRPEKNQEQQIMAFHMFLTKNNLQHVKNLKLILAGGCRSEEDTVRGLGWRLLSQRLDIEKNVLLRTNLSFSELLMEMENAGIAVHSMWNEHFGISVVECMAAGHIIIAHNSGGPKMDIIVTDGEERNGFLADDVESYANALEHIFKMPEEEQRTIRENARKSAERFSEANFEKAFTSGFNVLYKLCI